MTRPIIWRFVLAGLLLGMAVEAGIGAVSAASTRRDVLDRLWRAAPGFHRSFSRAGAPSVPGDSLGKAGPNC